MLRGRRSGRPSRRARVRWPRLRPARQRQNTNQHHARFLHVFLFVPIVGWTRMPPDPAARVWPNACPRRRSPILPQRGAVAHTPAPARCDRRATGVNNNTGCWGSRTAGGGLQQVNRNGRGTRGAGGGPTPRILETTCRYARRRTRPWSWNRLTRRPPRARSCLRQWTPLPCGRTSACQSPT